VEKEVILYKTASGTCPVGKWLAKFKDATTKARILRRLERLTKGYYGDATALGEGIFELRFFFATGYRVYFAEDGAQVVVLLEAGNKKRQTHDIARAKKYFQDYLASKG
jgi:putative addiction module killer protein